MNSRTVTHASIRMYGLNLYLKSCEELSDHDS